MAIDIADEQLMRIADAREWLAGRTGRAVAKLTIYRWTSAGVRGVVLEATHVGGILHTSVEALQRFCRRLDGEGRPAVPTTRRKREMAEASRRAKEVFG